MLNLPQSRPLKWAALSLAFAGVAGIAAAGPVTGRVFSRVKVNETEACAVVDIGFNITVQTQSYFPEGRGDHVRIDLKPIEVGRVNGSAVSREELRPPANEKAGIQEIQYDGDAPTGPVLTVTFNSDRYFIVDQGADFRSVILKISNAPIEGDCSAARPALRSGERAAPKSLRSAASDAVLFTSPAALDQNAVYALNLLSQSDVIEGVAGAETPPISDYAAYAVRFEEDGIVWNRLRLGFFKTRTDAQAAKDQIAKLYPEAWIVRTSDVERESVYRAFLASRKAAHAREKAADPTVAATPGGPPPAAGGEGGEAASLVAEARTEMTNGNLDRAIQILTKALSLPESAASADARELLGVAREKNKQLAHAKAEYEEYLRRYPEGEGAARVRQRLAAILSSGREAPPALREGASPIGKWVSRLTASLSQYYQRDESTVVLEQPDLVPDPDKQVNRNALVSGADVTASVSNDRFDTTLRFSGSHTKDFEAGGDDFAAVSALYLELADNVSNLTARFGRQTRSTGGVLGRFDGGLVSFDANENLRVNVVAGAPVIRSRDLFVDQQRRFIGGSVDLNHVVKGFDATGFFIYQTIDDLVDREAAGVELRYVDESASAYALIDYDVFYDTLNMALFNGSLKLKDSTTFNVSFDYRYAPTLMTLDALQGQGVETIDELRALFGFTDEEIHFLAEERAARTTSGSFTLSRPLTEKLQINVGATFANMAPTNDAGGVLGQPGTGVEAFYSAQLLATSVFKAGDLASFGLRFDDMQTARRFVVDVNTRYPFSRRFRVNPRFRYAYRDSVVADQIESTFRPSIRLNYIPTRLFQFELEGGGEWTKTTSPLSTETVTGYYVIAGYRIDF